MAFASNRRWYLKLTLGQDSQDSTTAQLYDIKYLIIIEYFIGGTCGRRLSRNRFAMAIPVYKAQQTFNLIPDYL